VLTLCHIIEGDFFSRNLRQIIEHFCNGFNEKKKLPSAAEQPKQSSRKEVFYFKTIFTTNNQSIILSQLFPTRTLANFVVTHLHHQINYICHITIMSLSDRFSKLQQTGSVQGARVTKQIAQNNSTKDKRATQTQAKRGIKGNNTPQNNARNGNKGKGVRSAKVAVSGKGGKPNAGKGKNNNIQGQSLWNSILLKFQKRKPNSWN
jgi:hypothetical protein